MKQFVIKLAIEVLKMTLFLAASFIIGIPLMMKFFEWFASLFGYTVV